MKRYERIGNIEVCLYYQRHDEIAVDVLSHSCGTPDLLERKVFINEVGAYDYYFDKVNLYKWHDTKMKELRSEEE